MLRTMLCLLLILPCVAASQTGNAVGVHIEVIADSSNHLSAELQVAPKTSARDLMERLFKMEYVDFSKRFVVAIAGFRADPKEKQYWKLEIDGVDSQVGIAEVVINKPARIRWRIARF